MAEKKALAEKTALEQKAASADKTVRITLTGKTTTKTNSNKASIDAQIPTADNTPVPLKSSFKSPQGGRSASGTRRVTLKDKVEIRKYRPVELLDGWQGGDLGIEDRITEASLNVD